MSATRTASHRHCAPAAPLVWGRRRVEPGRRLLERVLWDEDPAARLRAARNTGRLAELLPELAACVGFDQCSRHHAHTVDEHLFLAAGEAARLDAPWRIRIAALLHDVGKPSAVWVDETGRLRFSRRDDVAGAIGHDRAGARIAHAMLLRLDYRPAFAAEIAHLISEHMYRDDCEQTAVSAMGFLARVGARAAGELMLLRRCDWASKRDGQLRPDDEERLERFEHLVVAAGAPLGLVA